MARDPDLTQPPDDAESVQATKPGQQPVGASDDPYSGAQYEPEVDKQYWTACLSDAERAEQDWRKRAREIVQIYRNEAKNAKTGRVTTSGVTFNVLYANTEVMLPAVYQKPPKPVVRSRFTKPSPPPQPPMPPMLPGLPPGMPPPGMAPAGPPPVPTPLAAGPMPGGPPVIPPVPAPPLGALPPGGPGPMPGGNGAMVPPGAGPIDLPPEAGPAPPPMMASAGPGGVAGMPPPGPPTHPPIPPPEPPSPEQQVAETAAAVMEKALEIVLEDEGSDEAIKTAIKDVLLPGRGICRVRWRPQMQTMELSGGPLPDGTAPTEERKVWEEVGDEYVYWEDFLIDPVRQAADTDWMAFRHLFTRQQLDREFEGSPEYAAIKAAGKTGDLLRWTDESAAKSPVGGGSAMKTAQNLGDHVRKCMVWEIWDRVNRRIIWFIRETGGLLLRIDPDTLQLEGFFPCPVPLLAVTTSDSRIPRPYYDLYNNLAADLDEVSARISALTRMIKVRGGYNSASTEIADILTAGDGKMIPVDGVDMLNGGLQNHIWLVPIDLWMAALDKLFLAREQIKQAIYEIMGISDIMRGATKASETATAQRIKGTMGVNRLEDQRQAAANFVRDLLRLKAEIIAQNFDPATLARMTGEEVTPEVMAILRSDFMRTCAIDIESDSTVVPDLQAEQEGMAQIAQTIGLVMTGTQQMLMTGVLPPPQVMQLSLELMKMFLHPIRYSRPVVEMINQFQDQLAAQPPPMMMPPPMPGPPGEPPPGLGPPGMPPGGPPKMPPGGAGNGAAPPGLM
jgi:hypothetical protein